MPASPPNVRFGLFTANLTTGELFKGERKIDLERQPFLVLSALLSAEGQLVTREELQKILWPAGNFVDFNSGLNVAIKKLRDALGDSSENPRFIETLSRRGYRFIAPIERIENGKVEQSGSRGRVPLKMRPWLSAGAIAIVSSVCLTYWRPFAHKSSDSHATELKPVPLTSSPGNERSPALSPDGRRVAYSWRGESLDNADIYVKFTSAGNPVRLTTDPAADDMPVWSSDGQRIAFIRTKTADVTRSTIRIISALGGPDRELVELAPGECYRYGTLSWSPDGQWVAFADRTEHGQPFSIYMTSLHTGERRQVTSAVGELYGDAIPAFSPDGRMLAFVRLTDYSAGDVYVMPLAGKEPRRLTHDGTGVFGLSWTEDGKELVFSSERAGTARLWRVAASGGEPRPIPGISGSDMPHGVSQKGNVLVFSSEVSDQNIWRIDVEGPKGLGAPKLIAGSTRDDTNPQLSPDGTRLALASNRSGSYEIWVSDPAGLNPMPVTTYGRGLNASPAWSPDSRFIAFNSNISGAWGIYLVDARGGIPRLIRPDNGAPASAPSWSPDGKWIYFQSNRGGVMQIWKMPADGGSSIQLTKGEGWWPTVSPDGKSVYFARGGAIWKIPSTGGEEKLIQSNVTAQVPTAGAADWVPVSSGLYFLSREESRGALKFLDFATGRTSRIIWVDKDWDLAPLTASPDGKFVLFTQIDHGGADLMRVEHFQ